MKFIGITQHGTMLVEFSSDEWQNIGASLPTVEQLADQIKAFRAVTGMSQETFAKRAEISRNYLSMIETDKEPNLSLGIVYRIRDAMDLP